VPRIRCSMLNIQFPWFAFGARGGDSPRLLFDRRVAIFELRAAAALFAPAVPAARLVLALELGERLSAILPIFSEFGVRRSAFAFQNFIDVADTIFSGDDCSLENS
jgi:hypothetical protein